MRPKGLALRVFFVGIATAFFSIFTPAQAQVVTFPDANLEAAVRDALQIYAPTNILQSDLSAQSFTNLSLNGRGVLDLSGLQYATNLTFLQMQGNFGRASLTDISILTNFSKLTHLETAYNRITNASPVAGLTNLTYLDIGWNRDTNDNSIRDGSFLTNLRQLGWLAAGYLRLSDLGPVAGLTAVTNLNLDYNYGATNPAALSGLTNVIELYVNSLSLSNIDFTAQMPNLTKFDCGYCSVTNLAPLLGRNLQALWAYYNPVTNGYIVTNFSTLTLLHMDGDNLTNISSFGRLTALRELSLDNNPGIVSLSFLSGLTNLTFLSVGQLPLTNVTVLSGLTNLTELHLHDDTSLTDITSLAALTNLNNLDLNDCPGVNFDVVTNLVNLGTLDLDYDGLQTFPYASALPNLFTLSINYDQFTALDSLAGMRLGYLYLEGNRLGDINALRPMDSLYYFGVRNNYLDLNPASAAWQVISNQLARFSYDPNYDPVDYDGQRFSPSLTIYNQPGEDCVPVGADVYFAVSAATTSGTLQIQWQYNNVDLPGRTDSVLLLHNAATNQAGSYRALLQDDNGGQVSDAARLYVGDPYCGRTILIQQQPVNTVVAPGDDVNFTVAATTSQANLYYQWIFNGTNIDNATDSELDLFGVDTNAAGYYQVQLMDDSSNVVSSDLVQLKVVDVVPFVDPNLSNLVSQALGLSSGDPIHLSNLDNLNYLYISYQGVTNLTGLECARYLYSTDLSGNPIADPSPLSWLTSVNYLNLDSCGLLDASFVSGLTNLYDLNLANDQIHSVPDMDQLGNLHYLTLNHCGCLINFPRLAGLTNLVALSLHSDCVPDLSFTAQMTQLQTLDAGGDWQYDDNRNTISDLSPIADKTNMNWLSLSWDQATNVAIVGAFTNMTHLYLNGNPFQDLTIISNMPNLGELGISYSPVTNLAPLAGHSPIYSLDVSYIATSNLTVLAGLTNLTGLTAGGNHCGSASMLANLTNLNALTFELNDVPDASPLANMTNLYWLQLENNHIPDASPISNKKGLQYLYLTGNQIHDLTPLGGLTNLSSLSLTFNGFTNIAPIAGLTNLDWLVMQSNHIQTVAPLAGLTNRLNTLDVAANEITDISPATNLHTLTFLGAWQNRLTSLPSLVGLSNITSFDFWGNQLTNVSGVCGLTQLNWLGLSQNKLTTIQPLTGLPNLATIDAWGNQLTNVAGVSGLPSLNWLGLKLNNLTVIQPLTGLPNLVTLDLTTNHLTDISGLAGLTGLRWLYLAGNDLQNIHPLTNLTTLYYTDLSGNLLDTNVLSAAMVDIGVMQTHGAYVTYDSQRATFTLPPVVLTSLVVTNNQFKFKFVSQINEHHTVETSTDLIHWTILSTIPGDGNTKNLSFSPANQPSVFYRVRTHP